MRALIYLTSILLASQGQADRLHIGIDKADLLGFGFDRQSRLIRQPCLKGELSFHQNQSISFKVNQSSQFEQLIETYSGSEAIGVDVWLIGAKAKQTFLISNSETDQRMSMIWSVDYEFGTISLENRKLSLVGKSAIERDPDNLKSQCGDQFVHSARLGAKFYLATTIHFPSKAAYRRFKTTVSVSFLGGLIKKSKEFVKVFEEHGGEAFLSIEAVQLGGDQSNFNELIAKGPSYCSFDTITLCIENFKTIYQYMFADDGFQKSLADQPLENLYPLYFELAAYEDSGHNDLTAKSLQ